MSERTKTLKSLAGGGDKGTTSLLGGGRAPKDDPRIEAYGTVDEASSAIGFAKSLCGVDRVREICEVLQLSLYRLGAQLALSPEAKNSYGEITEEDVAFVDGACDEIEAETRQPQGFILPGTTPAAGALDVARTVVRRAERRVVAFGAADETAMRWLNRVSLLLFILARHEEAGEGVAPTPARARRGHA
jgi:cob(I)alamin adenosyltransferase